MEHPAINFLSKCAMLLLVILAPIQATMITVGFLIFLDTGTGIWAAFKRQEKITSAALRRTISKMIIYQLAVISGYLVETYLMMGLIPVAKVVAGYIGLVELKSILENGNVILGTDIFKLLIRKLGSKNDQL